MIEKGQESSVFENQKLLDPSSHKGKTANDSIRVSVTKDGFLPLAFDTSIARVLVELRRLFYKILTSSHGV